MEQASEAGEASQPVTAAHGDEAKRLQEMLKQYKRLLDESDSPLSLLWQFLIPFEGEYFAALAWYEQVYEVLKVPIVILLKLTIPIVDQELPNEGWIRPVATLQMFFFPLLLTGFVLVQDLGWLPDGWLSLSALAMVWGVTLCVSIAVATLVWTSSVDNKEPEFWRWMGFVGFVGALMIIYTTAKEIVNVILAFGVVFEVGTLLLGVTILAVGIGMQDLVTCVGVARAGYATMAASACVRILKDGLRMQCGTFFMVRMGRRISICKSILSRNCNTCGKAPTEGNSFGGCVFSTRRLLLRAGSSRATGRWPNTPSKLSWKLWSLQIVKAAAT